MNMSGFEKCHYFLRTLSPSFGNTFANFKFPGLHNYPHYLSIKSEGRTESSLKNGTSKIFTTPLRWFSNKDFFIISK